MHGLPPAAGQIGIRQHGTQSRLAGIRTAACTDARIIGGLGLAHYDRDAGRFQKSGTSRHAQPLCHPSLREAAFPGTELPEATMPPRSNQREAMRGR